MAEPKYENVTPLHAVGLDEAKYTELNPNAERSLVYILCTEPRAWRLVGEHIVPDCLQDKRGKLCLEAAKHIARETGEGPSNTLLIAQRLHELKDKGQVNDAQIAEAMALLDEVEDASPVDGKDIDYLISRAAKVVRTRARNDLLQDIITTMGKDDKPLSPYIRKIESIEVIGKETIVGAQLFGNNIWSGIISDANDRRLPSGIAPIDIPMAGGITPKSLTIWGAEMGIGKSAMLIHQCGFSVLRGLRCIYISLEESANVINARMASFFIGELTDEVSIATQNVQDKLTRVMGVPGLGSLVVEYMGAGATVAGIRKVCEDIKSNVPAFAEGWDALYVDYLDVPQLIAGSDPSAKDHQQVKQVSRDLRNIAVDNGNWVVTASQLKALDNKKDPPKQTDLADGRGKAIAADCIINIFMQNEDNSDERSFYVAKCRGTGAHTLVGPIPHELYRGRMSVLPSIDMLAKLSKIGIT